MINILCFFAIVVFILDIMIDVFGDSIREHCIKLKDTWVFALYSSIMNAFAPNNLISTSFLVVCEHDF